MNPHQKNKIDMSKMTEEEQRIFKMYGKVPNTKDLLQNKLNERKYFDSGDYALSKAGKSSDTGVTTTGSQHPVPESIPHLSSPTPDGGTSGTPGATAGQRTSIIGGVGSASGFAPPPSTSPVRDTGIDAATAAPLMPTTSGHNTIPPPAASTSPIKPNPTPDATGEMSTLQTLQEQRERRQSRGSSMLQSVGSHEVPARWQS